MDKEIIHLFRDIPLVCDDLGLIGREMFTLPSRLQNGFKFRQGMCQGLAVSILQGQRKRKVVPFSGEEVKLTRPFR